MSFNGNLFKRFSIEFFEGQPKDNRGTTEGQPRDNQRTTEGQPKANRRTAEGQPKDNRRTTHIDTILISKFFFSFFNAGPHQIILL